MRPVAFLLSLTVLLGACGADGPPTPPPARDRAAEPAPAVGVEMSGTAEIGVGGSL